MSEPSRWCPSCGAEYLPHITVCPDCGVPVNHAPPPPADHNTGAYDLSGATEAERGLVELLMRGAGIAYSWEDTTLIVARVAEAQVEELLEQLDLGDDHQLNEERLDRHVDVHLRTETLDRVGTAMYLVGGSGIAVAVIQAMGTADLIGGSGDDNLLRQVAYVLGSYSTVLLSALAIAAGALCRTYASGSTRRRTSRHVLPVPSPSGWRRGVGPSARSPSGQGEHHVDPIHSEQETLGPLRPDRQLPALAVVGQVFNLEAAGPVMSPTLNSTTRRTTSSPTGTAPPDRVTIGTCKLPCCSSSSHGGDLNVLARMR